MARHERAGSQSAICVICLIGVLISAMSLGSLRLYGLYLEHRLAAVTMRIEAVGNKNAMLEERYSSLLSPSRIYNYAKSELKMVSANEIETIRLNEDPGAGITIAALSAQDAERAADPDLPGGFITFLMGVANAQD